MNCRKHCVLNLALAALSALVLSAASYARDTGIRSLETTSRPAGTAKAESTSADAEINAGAPDSDRTIAWGKAVEGLRAGVRFYYKKPHTVGQQVWLDFFVRNASGRDLTFSYVNWPIYSDPAPVVTDVNGKAMDVVGAQGQITKTETKTLKPAEILLIGHPFLITASVAQEWRGGFFNTYPVLHVGPGAYLIHQDLSLSLAGKKIVLTSGMLSLPLAEHRIKTAWGAPVNGLQAGLEFDSDMDRYAVGDTVVLNMYLRNVTNKPITFTLQGDIDNHLQPDVIDKSGGRVPVNSTIVLLLPTPSGQTLQPGQMLRVDSPQFALRPTKQRADGQESVVAAGPGRYTVRQPLWGMISLIQVDGAPAESNPVSGDLTMEVTDK